MDSSRNEHKKMQKKKNYNAFPQKAKKEKIKHEVNEKSGKLM